MSEPATTVLIEYRAQPDRVADAVSEIERLIATVVANEPDCFGIRFLQDAEDPRRLLLIERWSSRDAYLGPHFETPHLRDFIARATTFFTGPPEIHFWHERSEATTSDGASGRPTP